MPKSTSTSASALREERRRASASTSSLVDTSALARLLLDKKSTNFLTKLFAHLQDHHSNPGEHDIRWCSDNKTLAVAEPKLFADMVLPRLYKHSNFETFIRQMDIYGFSRCQPLTDGKLGERLWIHEKFDRFTSLSEAITYQRRAGPKSKINPRRKDSGPSSNASRKRVNPYHGWGGKRPGLDIVHNMTSTPLVVERKQRTAAKPKEEEHQLQEDLDIVVEEEEKVVIASKVEEPVEPVASPIEDQRLLVDSVAVPLAIESFADVETGSVTSEVESTRSFASLSSFTSSSRSSSPSVNLLGVSTLPPRSRLNTMTSAQAPVHTPYRRSISLTSPLASFAASRALRGNPLTIAAPLPSSFYHHRSPIPSPLDPPSFPFPTQNQLQSPPSSPRISIASEDSALRTPLGSHWELEEVGELNLGRGRVASGSGRRNTVGSMDRLPGIFESVGASGLSENAMGRRSSDVGRGQDCYQPMSPPPTRSYYAPPSPQHQYASSSSVLFGSNSTPYYHRLQSPPSPYYEPSPAPYSYPPPPQHAYQHARHAPVEGYQQQHQQHPRFASTSRGGGGGGRGFSSQVRRVQSSGNLIGRKSAQGW